MSLFNEEQLDCPKCRKQVPFILHSSINVGIDPQDKEKVLDLSIFQYHCPHCGASGLVCYPVLYHDPEQGVWIQVFWREEDFGQPVEKELRDFIQRFHQRNGKIIQARIENTDFFDQFPIPEYLAATVMCLSHDFNKIP